MTWQWVTVVGMILLFLLVVVFVTSAFSAMKDESTEDND